MKVHVFKQLMHTHIKNNNTNTSLINHDQTLHSRKENHQLINQSISLD